MSNHHFRSQTTVLPVWSPNNSNYQTRKGSTDELVSLMSTDASALPDVSSFFPHRLLTSARLLLLNPSVPKKGHNRWLLQLPKPQFRHKLDTPNENPTNLSAL